MSDDTPAGRQAESGAPEPPAPERAPSSGGRTGGIIVSSIVGLFGLAILLGGLAIVALHAFARDDDGFYSTGSKEQFQSPGYALTTERIDLGAEAAGVGVDDLGATVRIDAVSASGRPLFLGIGPTADVARYLGRVAHTEVVDFGDREPDYAQHPGGRPSGPPAAQTFWVARAQGTGEQRIDWAVENGTYTAVAMNAGATRGVDIEVDAAAKVSWLIWVGIGLTVIGLLIVGSAAWLIARLGRRPEPV
jgi:hypothetical protein